MSLNPFNTPLALKISPSRQKAILILTPHCFALILAISLDTFHTAASIGINIALIFLISLSARYYINLHYRQSLKKSITMIYQDSAKNWFISSHDSKRIEVQLLDSSFVSQFLMVINFIDLNKHEYPILITPDSLPKDDYRLLIVKLKMSNQ